MRVLLPLAYVALASADCYLHNPRGSNNRLDDNNRDRNNANRLFDSQNNNRGGSNVGNLEYYAGSSMDLMWSVQHSQGMPLANVELIVQVMCDDRIRDGTTTNRIPTSPNECYNWDCDTDVRFGRHESLDSYWHCRYRERNKGLFTSSQNLNGNNAIYTRQNPAGGRRGLECPEERDYYPYWGPTPWRDIAILTNDPERCAAYQAESQNVKPRMHCDVDIDQYMRYKKQGGSGNIPITEEACGQTEYMTEDNSSYYGEWKTVPAHGIPAPACQSNFAARDNHHGNPHGNNGQFATYKWVIPDWMAGNSANPKQCVMRMRYNISTKDFNHFDGNTIHSTLNASNNKSPGGNNQKPANVTADMAAMYDLSEEDVLSRDYTLRNNPQVDAFGVENLKLQLAINTAQYGRTFEDRSHMFQVKPRPNGHAGQDNKIINLNVRGKRGNIVQTYPGTEYSFVPPKLSCSFDQYIHIQWTGSNTNPNNNAGQGRQGTDRSNIVMLRENHNGGCPTDASKKSCNANGLKQYGGLGSSYFVDKYLDKVADGSHVRFLQMSQKSLMKIALASELEMPSGELSELDDDNTAFDGGLHRCAGVGSGDNEEAGVYNYMSSRNNNFSNRSQKGVITIGQTQDSTTAGTGASTLLVDGVETLVADVGDLSSTVTITITKLAITTLNQQGAAGAGLEADHAWLLAPTALPVAPGRTLTLKLPFEPRVLALPTLKYAALPSGPYTVVDGTKIDGQTVVAEIRQGGYYVVDMPPDGGAIAGLSIGLLAGCGLIGFVAFKWLRRGKTGGVQNKI